MANANETAIPGAAGVDCKLPREMPALHKFGVATGRAARNYRSDEAIPENGGMGDSRDGNRPDLGMKNDSAGTNPNLPAMSEAQSKSEVGTDNATPILQAPLRRGPAPGRWKWAALAITAGLAILVCVAVSLSYEHREPDGSYTRLDFRGAARLKVTPELDRPEPPAEPAARPKACKPPRTKRGKKSQPRARQGP